MIKVCPSSTCESQGPLTNGSHMSLYQRINDVSAFGRERLCSRNYHFNPDIQHVTSDLPTADKGTLLDLVTVNYVAHSRPPT